MYAAAQEKVSISAGSEPDLRTGRFADGSRTLARAGGSPTQGGLLSEPGLEAEKEDVDCMANIVSAWPRPLENTSIDWLDSLEEPCAAIQKNPVN